MLSQTQQISRFHYYNIQYQLVDISIDKFMARPLLSKGANELNFLNLPGMEGGAMNETKRLWIILGAVKND